MVMRIVWKVFPIVITGLSLTSVFTILLYRTSLETIREYEGSILTEITLSLKSIFHIKLNQDFISTFIGFVDGQVTRSEYDNISKPLHELTETSTSSGWVPMVYAQDREKFVSEYAQEFGEIDFKITILIDEDIVEKPIDTDTIWPILYSNPWTSKFTGFDMASLWGEDIQEMIETRSTILIDLVPLGVFGFIEDFFNDKTLEFSNKREEYAFFVLHPVFNTTSSEPLGLIMEILFPGGIILELVDQLDPHNIKLPELYILRKRKDGSTEMVFSLSERVHDPYGDSYKNTESCKNVYTNTFIVSDQLFTVILASDTVPEFVSYGTTLLICIVATIIISLSCFNQIGQTNSQKDLVKFHKESTDLKSEFLAEMSHELRTPLNGIVGTADILSTMDIGKEASEYIQDVKTCSTMLMSTISEILDFSKIEAGKLTLDIVGVRLNEFIPEIVKIMTQSYNRKETFGRVELHLVMDVPSCQVFGDKTRLRQIIMNFVCNAFKFTDAGSIMVNIHVNYIVNTEGTYIDGVCQRGVAIDITVEDTGIGMDNDKVSKLFRPFSQVHRGRSENGTGLGLVITKAICDAMGGYTSCKSQEGIGTTFKARVLFGINDSIQVGTPRTIIWELRHVPRIQVESSPIMISSTDSEPKVLIVDDVHINRKVLSKMLQLLNLESDTACDGVQAIEMCRMKKYSIIFMDYYMPGMTGPEVIIAIRKDTRTMNKETVTVGLTASGTEKTFSDMKASGMDDYMTKPVGFKTIKGICEKYKVI